MLISPALALAVLTTQAPSTSPVKASSAPAQTPAPDAKPVPDGAVIVLETTMGPIQIQLYGTKSPLSSRNVLNYVKNGFYNGTIFHRVIPGFMIQGGGMDAKMVEKPTGGPVRNEARNGLSNTRGSVAMARTNDPQSATSQFFVNVRDNLKLDFGISADGWGYTVVGEVVSGMEVVDAIVNVPTTRVSQYENVPITPVVITRARVISEPPTAAPPTVTKAGAPAPTPARPATSAPKAPAKPKATPSPKG